MKNILISSVNSGYKGKLKKIILGNWYFETYKKKNYYYYYNFKDNKIKLRKKLLKESFNLEKKLYNEIIPPLNKYHSENKDIKTWKIIIGHWLRSYIRIFTNRYIHLDRVLKKNKIDHFYIKENVNNYYFHEIGDFLNESRTERFNDEIYKKVLEFKNTNTKFIIKKSFDYKIKKKTNIIKKIINFINSPFFLKNKFFLIDLYLSKISTILIFLRMNTVPKFWQYTKFENYTDPDFQLRKSLEKKLNISKNISLYNFLKENLFFYMPTAYIENYQNIKKFTEKNFPPNPKIIMTANSFLFNETFKNYTSNKIAIAKYIVMQHGNNYNTHFDEQFKSIEQETCDYFINWGLPRNKKEITGFMQKKLKKNQSNPANILIMHQPFDLRDKIWNNFEDYTLYIKSIEELILKINEVDSIKKIIYRVSNNHFNIDGLNYFRLISNKIFINFNKTNFVTDLNNSNICLFTYCSSGFYENLSNNIPTIMILNKSYLDEIDQQTRKFFLHLEKVNIIFFSSSQLKKFLIKNWKHLDLWWNSTNIQNTIQSFCDNFAKRNSSPEKQILKILKLITK